MAKKSGKINLAKVDIDNLGELAAKYEVLMFSDNCQLLFRLAIFR